MKLKRAASQNIDQQGKDREIIAAAAEVFAGYGFRKVTMDDVARQLGMVRSALYYYYGNKGELFRAVLDSRFDDYSSEVRKKTGGAAVPGRKLAAFSSCLVVYRNDLVRRFRLNYEEMQGHYDIIQELKSRVLSLHVEMLTDIFLEAGLPMSVTTRRMAHILSMSLLGVVYNSPEVDDKSLARNLAYLCRVFYNGLKGRAR